MKRLLLLGLCAVGAVQADGTRTITNTTENTVKVRIKVALFGTCGKQKGSVKAILRPGETIQFNLMQATRWTRSTTEFEPVKAKKNKKKGIRLTEEAVIGKVGELQKIELIKLKVQDRTKKLAKFRVKFDRGDARPELAGAEKLVVKQQADKLVVEPVLG